MNESALRIAMQVALSAACDSPDPSTQNGAALMDREGDVVAYDCNRFPDGVKTSDERWERPIKYRYVEHAERNVIFTAARQGYATENVAMVCPWAACSDCARAIVQAGITDLYRFPFPEDATNQRWYEDCQIGDTILEEGGVFIREREIPGLAVPLLRRDGKKLIVPTTPVPA